MIRRPTLLAALSAAGLAVAVVGCQHDNDASSASNQGPPTHGPSMAGEGDASGKPLEGNPGATTNQATGYGAMNDVGHYHPQTDDTKQYHPASPAAVQPATQP